MATKKTDYRELVGEVRRQLGISQEDLTHELGLSLVTVNRWENGQVRLSRLARNQFRSFYDQMEKAGRLDLSRKTQ